MNAACEPHVGSKKIECYVIALAFGLGFEGIRHLKGATPLLNLLD